MANEVIIEEYSGVGLNVAGVPGVQVPGKLVTTQILTIATASAQFAKTTAFIRLQSKGTGFWYILGGASPDAAANTAGNRWLPADQFRDLAIDPSSDLKIDTA